MNYKEQIAEMLHEAYDGHTWENCPEPEYWYGKADQILSLLTEDKCPECKGEKVLRHVNYLQELRVLDCPTCHGTGKPVKECPECKGMGYGFTYTCPNCKGKGWLPDDGLLTLPLGMRTVDNLKEMVRLHFESGGLLSDFLPNDYAQDLYVLDDDQELPDLPESTLNSPAKQSNINYWRRNGHQDMVANGWRKVKPYKRGE